MVMGNPMRVISRDSKTLCHAPFRYLKPCITAQSADITVDFVNSPTENSLPLLSSFPPLPTSHPSHTQCFPSSSPFSLPHHCSLGNKQGDMHGSHTHSTQANRIRNRGTACTVALKKNSYYASILCLRKA